MMPMPKTLREMRTEAIGLGLLVQGSIAIAQRKKKKAAPRAKLLEYAYNSHLAGRSFLDVTMMLLGISGTGKSSTINHLLGVNIAPTSASKSETRNTTEFVLTAEDDTLEVSDLRLVNVTQS